ncbi:MAG: hypothetical protein AAB131_00125 [Actinomycetota bacterium]
MHDPQMARAGLDGAPALAFEVASLAQAREVLEFPPGEAARPIVGRVPHRGEIDIPREVVVGVLHKRLRPPLRGTGDDPAASLALVDDVDRTHRLPR